jgi:CheY-like chemotaxis protein
MDQEEGKIKKYEIVSMTAFEDKEMKKKILKSGVDSIINKPCNKSELLKIISKLRMSN